MWNKDEELGESHSEQGSRSSQGTLCSLVRCRNKELAPGGTRDLLRPSPLVEFKSGFIVFQFLKTQGDFGMRHLGIITSLWVVG